MTSGPLKRYGRALVEAGRLADCGLILGSGVLSLMLNNQTLAISHLAIGVLACLLFVAVAGLNSLYGSWRQAPLAQEIGVIVGSWIIAAALFTWVIFLTGTLTFLPRQALLAWMAIAPVCMVFLRFSIRPVLRTLRVVGRNYRRAAIVGATDIAEALQHEISGNSWMGIEVAGVWDDRMDTERTKSFDLAGPVDDLLDQARRGDIDIVYIALPMSAGRRITRIIDACCDTTVAVYYVPDLFTYGLLNSEVKEIGSIPLIGFIDSPFSGFNWLVKRIEDIVVATVGLVITSLPMLAIALAVKLTSRGPVLFKQERHGEGGKEITVYKFRTMTVSQESGGFRQATVDDPRLTSIGAFLRRTSLDELPQLLNVLQGTMAIVGPRPHPVELNESHRGRIPKYMLRHTVKPGITGLAQVNGARGETDTLEKMETRVRYDLEYINSWSLLLDLKIIFLTVLRVWSQKEAF